MNRKIMGGFLGALFLLLSLSAYAAKANSAELTKAPEFSVKDINGKETITLSKYKGKVVLLNFWATWCPPCRMEIPDLIELYQTYSNKFVVIGVSVDEDKANVPAFVKDAKINYPVIYVTEKMLQGYGSIAAIPTSFIINSEGEIVSKITGYRNKAGYETIIKPFLKK